ncbi:MAG: DNA-binding transcriptional regulator [Tepidisphaeraceae bacterium]
MLLTNAHADLQTESLEPTSYRANGKSTPALKPLVARPITPAITRTVIPITPPTTLRSGPPAKARTPNGLANGIRQVAILVETSGAYGRGLLQGIARYNRDHGGWSTYFRPHGLMESAPAWLSSFTGDGMLVRIETAQTLDLVRQSGVPVVNLRGTLSGVPFPYVCIDNLQVAQLAIQHLRERGLTNFALCGRPRGVNPNLDERCDQFINLVERDGVTCHVFDALEHDARAGWEHEQARLAEWIGSLPKPVGVMACNDERGLQVLDACRRCGVIVPDDVAVIGVDNDQAICDLAIPPLTSIDVNAEAIGFEAAAMLDRMMNGETAPKDPVRLSPRGVVTRRSTDIVASEDEEVGRALRYIRENACGGLQVVDVLAHMAMSRASLQQRMKQVVGRTIHQEIQRVRLSRVKDRLAMSDMTIKQVARESGFASVQYMTRVFRAITGETPARYRIRRTR